MIKINNLFIQNLVGYLYPDWKLTIFILKLLIFYRDSLDKILHFWEKVLQNIVGENHTVTLMLCDQCWLTSQAKPNTAMSEPIAVSSMQGIEKGGRPVRHKMPKRLLVKSGYSTETQGILIKDLHQQKSLSQATWSRNPGVCTKSWLYILSNPNIWGQFSWGSNQSIPLSHKNRTQKLTQDPNFQSDPRSSTHWTETEI